MANNYNDNYSNNSRRTYSGRSTPRKSSNARTRGGNGGNSGSTGSSSNARGNFMRQKSRSSFGANFDAFLENVLSWFTRGSRFEHDEKKEDQRTRNYSGYRMIFNPVYCYWILIACVTVLTLFGLLMVFSSTIARLASANQPVWQAVLRQGVYAVVGIIIALVVQAVPVRWFVPLSWLGLLGALVLQMLTLTSLGRSAGGNTGWIVLGPISFQPAEIMKLVLCLCLPVAVMKAYRDSRNAKTYTESVVPFLAPIIIVILAAGLVILGKDIGTAMIVILIGVTALFIGGFSLMTLVSVAAIGIGSVILIFVFGSSNRLSRILATYGGCQAPGASQQGICFQSLHGDYALATGGLWGVGLGNSREKWSYLPAADNDYIFAIIAEEWGFIGAISIILLVALMGWCLINLSLRHQNVYMQIVLMCLTVWFTGQSFVNILVVLGVLPVMGLPLPFISSGGSALIMCLAGAGVAIRFAREQEDVRATLVKH